MSKDVIKQLNNRQRSENPYEGREGLVYARVSSKRQEIEGTGLQSQEGRCVKELQSIGVPYIKTFPDSYTGGGDFMNRPAMCEMLAYMDAHPHKKFLVVFDDLKRFARDVEFHLKLRTVFKVRDVLLKCLNYSFDESPEGRFSELIMAGQAELERHQNRRQVIQKQKSRLELGYWPFASRKPYKMTKDPLQGNILKLQYPEAGWLKEAMESFSNGTFIRKIDACKFLVEKGYWKKQSVEKYIDNFSLLCRDVLFAGYIAYPKWEVEKRKGHHEALISLETYNLIQKRLRNEGLGKRIRIDISEDFPIRGLSLCANCNKPLTGAWSKGRKQKYPYYFCQNKECIYKSKSILKKDIEEDFDTLLQKQHLKQDVGLLVGRVFDDAWKEEKTSFKDIEANQSKNKIELKTKIEELTNIIIKTKNETVRGVYEKQIEDVAIEMSDLEEESIIGIDLDVPYRTAIEKAVTFLESPYKIWKDLDVVEQHSLFYFIFDTKIPYDIKEGYRTDSIPSAVRLFEEFATANSCDVEMPRIELGCK